MTCILLSSISNSSEDPNHHLYGSERHAVFSCLKTNIELDCIQRLSSYRAVNKPVWVIKSDNLKARAMDPG